MTKLRLLSAVTLAAALLLPTGAVVAQDDADASSAAEATLATDDPRLAELEGLLPPALAGLPLGDNLTLATGEELVSVMQPGESDILLALLDEHGKTTADYAAAMSWLPVTDSDIAGRPVTLVSDDARPDVPLLHLFSAADVMWMIVSLDETIVEEAMEAVDADDGEGTEAEPAA